MTRLELRGELYWKIVINKKDADLKGYLISYTMKKCEYYFHRILFSNFIITLCKIHTTFFID